MDRDPESTEVITKRLPPTKDYAARREQIKDIVQNLSLFPSSFRAYIVFAIYIFGCVIFYCFNDLYVRVHSLCNNHNGDSGCQNTSFTVQVLRRLIGLPSTVAYIWAIGHYGYIIFRGLRNRISDAIRPREPGQQSVYGSFTLFVLTIILSNYTSYVFSSVTSGTVSTLIMYIYSQYAKSRRTEQTPPEPFLETSFSNYQHEIQPLAANLTLLVMAVFSLVPVPMFFINPMMPYSFSNVADVLFMRTSAPEQDISSFLGLVCLLWLIFAFKN